MKKLRLVQCSRSALLNPSSGNCVEIGSSIIDLFKTRPDLVDVVPFYQVGPQDKILIRNLKNPLKKSGIEYEKIIQSINNLSSSKAILDDYYLGISKELIKNWLNHLDKEKFNKNFPIDFLMNYLGDKIKLKLISKHFKDSIFLHGSFNGKVNSWQTVFNFKNNI